MTAGAFLRSHKQPGGVLVSLARGGGGGFGGHGQQIIIHCQPGHGGVSSPRTCLAAAVAAWSCCRRCCPGLGESIQSVPKI